MRVLCLINSLGLGGAERRLVEIAPLVRDRGVGVRVGVFSPGQGFDAELAEAGIAPVSLDGPGGWLASVGRVRSLVRDVRPDLVHTTLLQADLAGRAAAAVERVPCVSSIVNASYGRDQWVEPGVGKAKIQKVRVVDGVTARLVRRFHAVSEHVADIAARELYLRRDRIDVVVSGRDETRLGRRTAARRGAARAALGLDAGDVLLLAVGRHDHQKGLDVLLRALPTVTAALPQVRLAVAGHEGRQSAALYELRDRLGLAETVRFLGARTDVPELLCAADLFVFPSRWEGLSVAVLEAMALEAPIVASDIPPVREAVGEEAGAVLVPRERPELLARAVLRAVSDPGGCTARAAAARRRFLDSYTSDKMADGMVRFYERALAR